MSNECLAPNFLNDPSQYELSEIVWKLCWKVAIESTDRFAQWKTPWLKTCSDDGSPFRDGNPIFSAFSRDRQIGIRIIQDETEELSWRNDVLQDDIKTLTINCSLSEQNVERAFKLIRWWIDASAR